MLSLPESVSWLSLKNVDARLIASKHTNDMKARHTPIPSSTRKGRIVVWRRA